MRRWLGDGEYGWLCNAPTVGAYLELCEENYRALRRLLPDLHERHGALSATGRGATLHLEILAQSPYTTLLRLTHRFGASAMRSEPDAELRAYRDAEQVEILRLRQTVLPIVNDYRAPALHAKWRASWFLSKWLVFCLHGDYHFAARQTRRSEYTQAEPMTPNTAALPSEHVAAFPDPPHGR